jgi:Zn-dependent peptidase ImmA (M78 family)
VNQEQYAELADSAIENAAETLLTDFFASVDRDVTVPVPVESIAEQYLGYRIEITDEGLFQDPDFLGGVDFQSHTIFVNTSVEAHEGRYAFTIAHELGHHVLHKASFLSTESASDQKILCRSSAKRPMIEYQADRFAAALLMPSKPLKEAVRAVAKRMPRKHSSKFLASRLVAEGGFSNVSHEAMRYRLRELNLSPHALRLPRALLALSRILYRFISRILSKR